MNRLLSKNQTLDLLEYADYKYLNQSQIDMISRKMRRGLSIGDPTQEVAAKEIDPTTRSNIYGIHRQEIIYVCLYESYRQFIYDIANIDLRNIRSLIFEEESIQLNNQMLEYLCSGGNIEEIQISEERHTLTALPVAHLSRLRYLFICNDRDVSIGDSDLYQMKNLQLIALSHNNQITNKGISYLSKLIAGALYKNQLVDPNTLNNPLLEYIITDKYQVDENDPEICHWTRQMI